MVAQGDPARERPEGAARRGRDLRRPRSRCCARNGAAHDWYAFTVAFKGVFLEGLEVAFIIVTFGGAQKNVGLAAIGAAAALVVVLIAGVIVHAPLTRVPENTLKFGVGVMLTVVRHLLERGGRRRVVARADASLLGVIGFVVVLSFGLVALLRRAAITPVAAA